MSDDPVSSDEQSSPSGDITIQGSVSGTGIAIGHGASVTIVAGPPPLPPEESARLLAKYRARVLDETRYVNLRGIPLPRGRDGRPMPLQVPLDKVYIRVQATTEKQRRAQEEAEERSLSDRLRGGGKSESSPKDVLSTLHALGEYFYRRGEVYETAQRPEPVDPQEALKKHKRMVVLGAPGSGKSTLLRYLARRAAEDSGAFVPIQVSLRDYATALAGDNTLALSEFALRMASAGNSTLRQALDDESKNGRVLWLVDALDEARGWAANAARHAGQLSGQLILTSRPVGYVSTGLESLPHFEVLPLTPENVDEFLQSWFGLLATQQAADDDWTTARVTWLKKQLETRPRIRTLTRNPLLLTFLVILAGKDPVQELPGQRAELYRRYIEELLDSWEVERRPKSGAEGKPVFTLGPLQGEQARQAALLGFHYLGWSLHLAYYGGKQKKPPTHTALKNTLTEYLKSDWGNDSSAIAEAVLEFWREAGLLEMWHLDLEEYFSFCHLTFQEYAVAWGISESWKRDAARTWRFLCPYLHHYAWREPILLLVGLMDQQQLNDLASRLISGTSLYEKSLHRDLRLAGELLAEGAILDKKHLLIRKLEWLSEQHSSKRIFPLLMICLMISMLVLHFFLGSISSSSDWVFGFTAITISLSIIFMLCDALTWFPPVPRILTLPARIWSPILDYRLAYDLLARIGVLVIPFLIRELDISWCTKSFIRIVRFMPGIPASSATKHSDVSELAYGAFEQIGIEAVPDLIQVLQDRRYDADIRAKIARTLGNIGASSSIPDLRQTLQDGNPVVRYAVANALVRLGDAPSISFLFEALHDNRVDVRFYAARALGGLEDPQVVSHLCEALQDNDDSVRWAVTTALGETKNSMAISHLGQVLKDEDSAVRQAAAEALGNIGDSTAIPELSEALRDDDSAVCQAAAQALTWIGDPQAIPHLSKILQELSSDEDGYMYALLALGDIGGSQVIPHIIPSLKNSDTMIRMVAAIALGLCGDSQAIPYLNEALRDNDADVRWAAAAALNDLDRQSRSLVDELLNNRNIKSPWSAITVPRASSDSQAISHLIHALKYSGWNVCHNAIGILSDNAHKISDIRIAKHAAQALWWLLTDVDLAEEAFRALDQIANRLSVLEVEAMPLVDPLLPDPKRTKKR
jgi:HEAT repeat protein